MGQKLGCTKMPKIEINSNCCKNETSNSIHYCSHCGSRVNLKDLNRLKNGDYDALSTKRTRELIGVEGENPLYDIENEHSAQIQFKRVH